MQNSNAFKYDYIFPFLNKHKMKVEQKAFSDMHTVFCAEPANQYIAVTT